MNAGFPDTHTTQHNTIFCSWQLIPDILLRHPLDRPTTVGFNHMIAPKQILRWIRRMKVVNISNPALVWWAIFTNMNAINATQIWMRTLFSDVPVKRLVLRFCLIRGPIPISQAKSKFWNALEFRIWVLGTSPKMANL